MIKKLSICSFVASDIGGQAFSMSGLRSPVNWHFYLLTCNT